MLSRITSLALALAIGASVVVGTPLHSSEHNCTTPPNFEGCSEMEMEPSAAVLTTALCCFFECQEPGPTESAFNLRTPTFRTTSFYNAALMASTTMRPFSKEKWLQSSSFTPPDTYLKNLALLI